MYKLLLAWRYLRTRYIALASIVSVTLGVATLVVVNSVMSGFTNEMQARLKGILSDIELASPGLGEIYDVESHLKDVRQILGDDVQAVSAIVRVPALLHQDFRGRMVTQQVMLMGIDDATYSQVSDFSPYLLSEQHRKTPSFDLLEGGYDPRLGPDAGWNHRRAQVAFRREQQRLIDEAYGMSSAPPRPPLAPGPSGPADAAPETASAAPSVTLTPLPDRPPMIAADASAAIDSPPRDLVVPGGPPRGIDPFREYRAAEAGSIFDPAKQQHPGIVLGIALSNRKFRDPDDGLVRDVFLDRPGDDVQLTLLTAGTPPRPASAAFTVVDYYESKMHEYDSTLVFAKLSEVQKIRQMIAPDGSASVSAIQIKLKPGADLESAKRKLSDAFPADIYPYQILTWKDVQGPLLSAVQLEITILNILLFMIIAVAGFGILATFFMIVVEKTRDIGILKALGAPSRGVMSIFLGYGLSLGLVGSGAGIVMGLLFVAYINEIAKGVEWISGREVFDPTIYYFTEIPTMVEPFTVTWIAIGAMMIAVLASVLPARHAARLHPVEALRYE